MSILVDLNQVLISNLMKQIATTPKSDLDENLIRHMVLNSLRSYAKQFKSQYGDIIIACDSKKYWRREIFPFYKAHRKKDRENSGLNWHLIFETLNKIRDELKLYFPYRVLEVEGAEADDIIAVLTARMSPNENILILSSDKDFVQLQKYPNVFQYSPILKRFVTTADPQQFIKEHILRGDRGDGIPNFLSPDNTFALGERQKVISKKKLVEWVNSDPKEFCITDTMMRGYKRNQLLVDLDCVPENIKENIVKVFEETKPGTKQKMLNYFIQNRMKYLIEVIDEF
jgi:5'-3' exonuclease